MAEVDLNLLAKVSDDRALASALLFDHRHPEQSCPAHVQVIDAWRSADPFVVIEAFREFGKSTLSEEFLCLEGCFGNFHYCLLIAETYEKAVQRLAAIAYEARTNVKLHRLFGGTVLARKPTENKLWFKSGALIEAHGWDQELQSFKEGEHRPDRAYLDDPENLERVRDEAAVKASMRKLMLELLPALDKKRRKIRITQTRRAKDCMVTRLMTNAEWVYVRVPICDRDPDDPHAVATWPARYPMDWIRNEKRIYASDGHLAEFNQSYMLTTSDPASKPFREDMLQAVDLSPWHWMPKVAIYDPARTANSERTDTVSQSNRYGKIVASRRGTQILVHESRGAYWKPSELIDDVFRTHETHQCAKIAIEKDSLDDWIMQPMRAKMLERGVILPLVGVNAPRDVSKEQFILSLQPFVDAGEIVLVGGLLAHPHLVAELTNFPEGPRDVVNCLAYTLRMFAGQPVYPEFSAANVGEAPDPRTGETVYTAFAGNESDSVGLVVIRDGQRFTVARDWSGLGRDGIKSIVFEMRAAYPRATFETWAPADAHDQWQRVPLVSQLRAERLTPFRGAHTGEARGCLSQRIRTEWRGKRMLMVDRKASITLNALAMGYTYQVERGGRMASSPETGPARLAAEALEAMVQLIERAGDTEPIPRGANVAYTPAGIPYVSSHPGRKP